MARVGKPSAIAALQEPRRTATIAALFHTLEAAAQDDAAELAGARGEIRSPLRQGQEEQLGVLGLALNSIVHWNAVYMQETLRQLSEAGTPPLAVDIARLSPISWRHINFLGRYEFSLPDAVANGGLRPLRQLIPNGTFEKK